VEPAGAVAAGGCEGGPVGRGGWAKGAAEGNGAPAAPAAGIGDGVAGAVWFSRRRCCDCLSKRCAVHWLIDKYILLNLVSISLKTAVWRRSAKYSVLLPIGSGMISPRLMFVSAFPLCNISWTMRTASVNEKAAPKSATGNAGKKRRLVSTPRMAVLIKGTARYDMVL
jgi:hypothetical protein